MRNIRERQPDMQSYGRQKQVKFRGVGPSRKTMRKMILWIAFTWVVVVANIILLMQMRRQIKDLNDAFVRLQGRFAVIAGDQALTDQSLDVLPEDATGSLDRIAQDTVTADYADLWGLDQVDKPKERTTREILRRLEELGKDSRLIAQVAETYQDYPEQLLEALANNPEMADFAAHYPENKGTVTGGLQRAKSHRSIRFFSSGIPGGDMLPMEMTVW